MWSKTCKTSTFIAKLFLKQHFRSETVSKAKLLKRDFFLAKLPKRNAFLAKRSETYEAKQSETKRNFISVVSRNWSETKRNCFCFAKFRFEIAKLGHPSHEWLPRVWYPGEIDSAQYDTLGRFLQKIWINRRNLDQNLMYFNPLLSGPDRLEQWKKQIENLVWLSL